MILLPDSEDQDQPAHLDAQADLGLRCPHNTENMFSHHAAHMQYLNTEK